MSSTTKSGYNFVIMTLQLVSSVVFLIAAIGMIIWAVLAAFGVWPWLSFAANIGDLTYQNAGQITQIALTALFVMLNVFLPTNRRVIQLEHSHRRFEISMQDVARAYAVAHSADRSGFFQMSSEFDAVRERLAYLREHPDLESLEPQLLEAAAQMSHISRELADVYSDDKIDRARTFLAQRQQEVDNFNKRIEGAKSITQEIKGWLHEVELEESVAASQLKRLREDLNATLPELSHEDIVQPDGTVVDLHKRAAE